jgi:hypothetical protein
MQVPGYLSGYPGYRARTGTLRNCSGVSGRDFLNHRKEKPLMPKRPGHTFTCDLMISLVLMISCRSWYMPIVRDPHIFTICS